MSLSYDATFSMGSQPVRPADRRFASLTSVRFCRSQPVPLRLWDGTDPAMRGLTGGGPRSAGVPR